MEKPTYPLQIFFDGACRLCTAQMIRFRERDKQRRLVFIDISSPEFKPEDFDLDPDLVQKYMYARDAHGRLARGLDAFIWIWQALDYGFLPWVAGLPGIKPVGKFFYRVISNRRYWLGKGDKNACDFLCAKEM